MYRTASVYSQNVTIGTRQSNKLTKSSYSVETKTIWRIKGHCDSCSDRQAVSLENLVPIMIAKLVRLFKMSLGEAMNWWYKLLQGVLEAIFISLTSLNIALESDGGVLLTIRSLRHSAINP